ncbi:MAG TPA: XdhC/CoxI family protein [Anaerolineales bacterium]|nr:XdhC/CoxI family protein [Anaerolineales bacterium]
MTLYQAIVDIEKNNETGALCTIIGSKGSTPRHVTSKMLVYPDGHIIGTVGGGEVENRVIKEALDAIKDRSPRLLSYNMANPERGDPGVCGGQVEIYVEPLIPKPVLVVVGVGHVGKAVAHLAKWLGFVVAVTDDRPEFCNLKAVPEADLLYPMPLEELTGQLKITPWTYVVLTTRGIDIDIRGLPSILNSDAAYIGVIGSKRRWATTTKKLMENGMPSDLIQRVHSPIGLEIHAETPEEIAVSIMAEIIELQQH